MKENHMNNIPFLNLKKLHSEIQEEINESVIKVVNSGRYLLDKELLKFEKSYSEYENVKQVIGVGSGLDALTMILTALNIGKSDEVIVPSHTFIATWLSVSNIGAIPVPVELNENTYNINIDLIENAITTKTKAIIVVNLYGQVADLEPVKNICIRNNLYLIEDAAQSHGALYKGKNTNSFSDAIATSFYPGKNLGCMGDGGAVLTNNDELAIKIKRLRNYGSDKKYYHREIGFNSRLDEIQASVLSIKLKYLKYMNKKREEIANFYLKNISNDNLILPKKLDHVDHVWHLFVIRSKHRDKIAQLLLENGIQTIVHYPIPPHRQECYKNIKFKKLDLTNQICSEIISLPLYPNMPESHIEYIVEKVNAISNSKL